MVAVVAAGAALLAMEAAGAALLAVEAAGAAVVAGWPRCRLAGRGGRGRGRSEKVQVVQI